MMVMFWWRIVLLMRRERKERWVLLRGVIEEIRRPEGAELVVPMGCSCWRRWCRHDLEACIDGR